MDRSFGVAGQVALVAERREAAAAAVGTQTAAAVAAE